MENYLKLAKEKRKNLNKITDEEMNFKMQKFIPFIFHRCQPSSYGHAFAKKVIMESRGFLTETKRNSDNGDFYFFNPATMKTNYGEIKISYQGSNGDYRITNIRDHQNLDYFILCFVDISKDFKPYFYLVPKEHVTECTFFKLNAMNGTKIANMDNKTIPKAMRVNYEDMDWYFGYKNILDGTNYSNFLKFITNKNKNYVKN